MKACEKAIGLDPELALAWTNKSAALLGLGRNEEGLEATEKGIELDPNNASAWYNKACAHSQLGQKEKMLDALEKAIELNPDYKEKAKTDSSFEPYRDDSDFQELVGEDQ